MTIPSVQSGPSRSTPANLEQIFIENYDLVYRTAYRVTGNGTDAEDVLQTLFLRLAERPVAKVLERGWAPYLHRAAVNASLDVVRRRARLTSIGDMEPWIPESRPDPYQNRKASELGARLRAALAEMHPRTAEIFVLRHVEGFGNREIARMLETSPGSIAVTLFRARSRLRKSLRSFVGGQ